jgi:hypothetical protein
MNIGGGRYAQPGRYVRGLGFRLSSFSYNPDTGLATIGARAHFSNESELPHWWTGRARLEGVLIQFKSDVSIKHRYIKGVVGQGQVDRQRLRPQD